MHPHQNQLLHHAANLDLDLDLAAAAAPPANDSRWEHASTLTPIVTVVQYAYPIFLLFFFLAAFTARSILSSNSNSNVAKPTTTGPGGKPLPATDPTRNFVKRQVLDDVTRSQKLVFNWLSLLAAVTFIGNAALVIAHAVIKRAEHWWSGKQVVVRLPLTFN